MIDKLEYLLALAQERHFGKAAEVCAVSQPSLSMGLKQLEDSLGVMLVQRGSRFIGLTAEGERTLEWARRIVSDTRAMRQDIKVLKQGLSGTLRIAVIPAALPMIATVTAPLRNRHPDVHFSILSRPSSEVLTMLDNLEVDAALAYIDAEPLNRVTTIPLYREQYHLLTMHGDPIASRGEIDWAEIGDLRLGLLTRDTQNRQIIEGLLRDAGGNPQITLESDSLMILLAHVRAGGWATIVPAKLAEITQLSRDFSVIPIRNPDVTHTIGIVMPVREPMTPLAAALASEARRIAATLMNH